ncbi:MAG: MotA/TolQ/ExbB proton channel family protein [Candidatus Margulisiibacteriota bacterium]|nr:MotA/TolQ/ExbB proton channel family protein [Candidatus Margulisiibacteriota bacterium]
MVKGGWIMGLILACSVVSLTVIIERFFKFWKVGKLMKNSAIGPLVVQDLEKNIDILGIVAHVAPLLGLLGTVTGMIRAFMRIEELAGRVNASVLAGGIWEALLTTAFGLVVAIPSFVMYHYFNRRVDDYALILEKEKEFEA